MPRGRVPCWKAEGSKSTPAAIASALQEQHLEIFTVGDAFYSTIDFGYSAMDPDKLEKWAPTLKKLRELGPLEMIFSQEDVYEALEIAIDFFQMGAVVGNTAQTKGMTKKST